MFTVEEEKEIERVNAKHAEISQAIKTLSASLSTLEEISKAKENALESHFEQLIFRLKNRKITLLDEFKKTSMQKKKILYKQLQQTKCHQKELNEFKIKYEQMILGESHGMDQKERKQYIMSTTKRLLSTHCDSHPIVNPVIKIDNFSTNDINELFQRIQGLGKINACSIPRPPRIDIKEIYASSIRIVIDSEHSDDEDTKQHATEPQIADITEYKIETKCEDTKNEEQSKWETTMIIDNRNDTNCMLRGLLPNRSYLIRVQSQNENGWSSYSKQLYFKTKGINKVGQRMVYLAPTPEYQNKLSILMTSYFTKWKGFHITIGGRCRPRDLPNISTSELIQELSELGEKKSNKRLWQIPTGKWKVLAGKDLIVLGLEDDISMLQVASKFLESKQWKNVKRKNFHITLGLKRDLNREQIKEMAHILVDKEDPVQWEWVSVNERPDGKIVWNTRFPAYDL